MRELHSNPRLEALLASGDCTDLFEAHLAIVAIVREVVTRTAVASNSAFSYMLRICLTHGGLTERELYLKADIRYGTLIDWLEGHNLPPHDQRENLRQWLVAYFTTEP